MHPDTRGFPWASLTILAVGIFLANTSEMMPTGVLPDVARDMQVSIPHAGLMMTAFAFTVVVSSAPLTHVTRRIDRKAIILVSLSIVALSAILTSMVPNYGLLLASRILGGAGHGLFWSVVGVYPVHLVKPKDLGRAISFVAAGATLAFALGVPLGVWLGHLVGWRVSFLSIGIVLSCVCVAIALVLPPAPQPVSTGATAKPKVSSDPSLVSVVLIVVVVGLYIAGHFVFFTYVTPFLSGAGFDANARSLVLLVFGIAGVVGVIATGLILARNPVRSVVGLLVANIVGVIALLVLGAPFAIVAALFVIGFANSSLFPLMQAHMLAVASPRVRDLGGALFTTSSNLGIGGGAALGALVFGLSGVPATLIVDAAFSVAALAVTGVLVSRSRR